jgi:hypothetical protein
MISLVQYALAIADHLERTANSLKKYNDLIFDKEKYPDEKIENICRTSIHWIEYLEKYGFDETRKMIHDFYHEEAEEKPPHAQNLKSFAFKILDLLNSKYQYLKVKFEIEK